MKIVINGILMDADVKSLPKKEESAFHVEHTDFVELTNIRMPSKLTVPAYTISIPSEFQE